jgi:hypothetical protein
MLSEEERERATPKEDTDIIRARLKVAEALAKGNCSINPILVD